MKLHVRMLIIGANCRKTAKNQAIMDIFRKSLRVCAILLAGVLWSTGSQASGLARISKTIPGFGAASTSQQGSLAVLGSQIPELAYGAHSSYHLLRQEYLRIGSSSNKHYRLPGEGKAYGSIYIGSAFPGLGLILAPHQEQIKRFGQEVNDWNKVHSRHNLELNEVPRLSRDPYLSSDDKYYGIIYRPQRFGNNGSGHGGQIETKKLLRKLKRKSAEEATIVIARCLADHWDIKGPVDKDFVPNVIKECNNIKVWSKADLRGKGYFDKSATGYRPSRNNSPCFANGRDAVILNVPIWEREFYNSPNKWKEIQSQSALIPINRNLPAPGLTLPNGRRDFSSQGPTPGISGFGTTTSTYRGPGIQRYFDIGQSRAASFGLGNEAIGQPHKLSDCLALWEIKYRHNASIQKLKNSVIKDAHKGLSPALLAIQGNRAEEKRVLPAQVLPEANRETERSHGDQSLRTEILGEHSR